MSINLYKMKKDELLKFATKRCRHRHFYYEHPNCFIEEQQYPPTTGYLDIETNSLFANFGIMLSYAIKVDGKNEIIGRPITKEEIRSPTFDKVILKECIKDMNRFDRLITYNGCVTKGHRVLTADLRWVPVEDLKIGDRLLAFNEERPSGGRGRKWEFSTVIQTGVMDREVLELTLSDGNILQCTPDHPWLAGYPEYNWKKAENMNRGGSRTKLRPLLKMWEEPITYKEGWLSGFVDGEGSIRQRPGTEITITQKEGVALNRAIKYLSNLGFDFSVGKRLKGVRHIILKGGTVGVLEFLGRLKPQRLLQNLNQRRIEEITINNNYPPVYVKSIRNIGKAEVVTLGTTSKTYIVEGFGAHNTRFDMPFLRTRALKWKVEFPTYGVIKHTDAYYMARGRLRTHRKSMDVVSRALGIKGKNHVIGDIWQQAALQGDEVALGWIFDHNKRDVRVLEKVYKRLKDYCRSYKRSI